MGDKAFGMSAEVIQRLAQQIKKVHSQGVEVCIVVGGGNIFRGAKEASKGMNRTVADQVGMLATVMNALYIQNALEAIDVPARVLSGLRLICIAVLCAIWKRGGLSFLPAAPGIHTLPPIPALRFGLLKCSVTRC